MLRKIIIFLIIALIPGLLVYADDESHIAFIQFEVGQSTALSVDSDGVLRYIDMKDSKGKEVIPLDTTDGNTYLPFRFICELMGFDDKAFTGQENHFRYTPRNPEVWDSREKIEIYSNGVYVCHEVGEEFVYEASPGDVRKVCIYNINGSLYFPMTYMARLTGGATFWAEDTKEIIFATDGVDIGMYMDDNAHIKKDAIARAMYYPIFDFNKKYGCYVASDGVTVVNSDEAAENIYRIKNTLIFLDNGRIMTKDEKTGDKKEFSMKDNYGNPVKLLCEDFVIVKNKLFGINAENSHLFICDVNGSEFEYLTDRGVKGLYAREFNSSFYLYYCDRETSADIHMLDLINLDNYRIEITGSNRKSLLRDITSFYVTDKQFVYKDSVGRRHVIHLPDPLEMFEIARIADWQYEIFE